MVLGLTNLIACILMCGFYIATWVTLIVYRYRLIKNLDIYYSSVRTKDTLREIRNIERYIFSVQITMIQLCAIAAVIIALIIF